MKIIGVTGGIGSGKSQVLDYIAGNWKAVIVEADAVGYRLMQPGQPCYAPIVELFGSGIVGEDGCLDRKRIAELVFQDRALLEKLNAIVHPAVKTSVLQSIQQERARRPDVPVTDEFVPDAIASDAAASDVPASDAIVPDVAALDEFASDKFVPDVFVIEAALLIEAGYGEICDELWYIFADEKTRMERLRKSRGYSEKKIRDIFANQLKSADFRAHCDVEIDNSGDFEDTKRQIKQRMRMYETV